jgi:anti-anti-sigma factor
MAEYLYNHHQNILNCKFTGKLDTELSIKIKNELEYEVDEKLQKEHTENLKVIFDFRQVEFVTSAFIRLCILIAKKVEKANFSISGTNPFIKKTFKIAGLEQELNIS